MEKQETFSKGDLVQLKSGGPKMTVDSIHPRIICVWFAGAKMERGVFDEASLVSAEGDPKQD